MKQSQVKFNPNALRTYLTDWWIAEQNKRLVEYAKEEIVKIGNRINSYHSRYHMDRTGNLLNSLCWTVAYDNKLVDSGFYRDAVLHARGVDGTSESFLHEFYKKYFKYAYQVNGRELAANYVKQYGKMSGAGRWRVCFAILAPYWGYWEQGFTIKHGFSKNNGFTGATFKRFAVMAETYDVVSNELSPASVKMKVHVATYTRPYNVGGYKVKGSIEKDYINRVDKPQYNRKR